MAHGTYRNPGTHFPEVRRTFPTKGSERKKYPARHQYLAKTTTAVTSKFCPPGGSKAQKFYGKSGTKPFIAPLPCYTFQIKTPIPHQWCLQPPSFKASPILWATNKDSIPELQAFRQSSAPNPSATDLPTLSLVALRLLPGSDHAHPPIHKVGSSIFLLSAHVMKMWVAGGTEHCFAQSSLSLRLSLSCPTPAPYYTNLELLHTILGESSWWVDGHKC